MGRRAVTSGSASQPARAGGKCCAARGWGSVRDHRRWRAVRPGTRLSLWRLKLYGSPDLTPFIRRIARFPSPSPGAARGEAVRRGGILTRWASPRGTGLSGNPKWLIQMPNSVIQMIQNPRLPRRSQRVQVLETREAADPRMAAERYRAEPCRGHLLRESKDDDVHSWSCRKLFETFARSAARRAGGRQSAPRAACARRCGAPTLRACGE